MLVVIRESDCIGCTKCIQACPVDAIIGSSNQMHTVITNECIGCELCISPCPVDCIDLVQDVKLIKNKELALKRIKARKQRLNSNQTALPEATSAPSQSITRDNVGASLQVNQTLERIKRLRGSR